MYQALNPQQLLVLGKIYPAIEMYSHSGRRWRPEEVLGRQHCCPSCSCVWLGNPERQLFATAAKAAKESDRFEDVFAVWRNDYSAVALFGLIGHTKVAATEQLAFIDQWHVTGQKTAIPSYEEVFKGLLREYHSGWHRAGRIILFILIVFGIYFMAPELRHLADPGAVPMPGALGGGTLLAIGVPLAWLSLRRYLLLWK